MVGCFVEDRSCAVRKKEETRREKIGFLLKAPNSRLLETMLTKPGESYHCRKVYHLVSLKRGEKRNTSSLSAELKSK